MRLAMKHKILVVDGERRSARVLGVTLRSAGYRVELAGNAIEALERIASELPDVVVSDSELPVIDGYTLTEKLKARDETAHIPVVLLTRPGASEDRTRGRAIGVAEYLPKPVFVRELVACVELLVARSTRTRLMGAPPASRRGRASGSTADVSVVDILQIFEMLRESGIARLVRGGQEAEIHFREGRVIDAEVGRLRGEPAIYAVLVWGEAAFDVEFKQVVREDLVDRSTGTLLMEGMRRVDAWGRTLEQLRPLTTTIEADHAGLLEQAVARLFDGKPPSPDDAEAMFQRGPTPAGLGGPLEMLFASPPEVTEPHEETRQEGTVAASGDDDEDAVPLVRGVFAEVSKGPPTVTAAPPAASTTPSSPPWTREVAPSVAPDDDDIAIPGVRRAASGTARFVVGASVALALAICLVAGVRVAGMRRARDAENASGPSDLRAVAARVPVQTVSIAASAVARAPSADSVTAGILAAPPAASEEPATKAWADATGKGRRPERAARRRCRRPRAHRSSERCLLRPVRAPAGRRRSSSRPSRRSAEGRSIAPSRSRARLSPPTPPTRTRG
jgi:DNA-binding response OmpR family regulator